MKPALDIPYANWPQGAAFHDPAKHAILTHGEGIARGIFPALDVSRVGMQW